MRKGHIGKRVGGNDPKRHRFRVAGDELGAVQVDMRHPTRARITRQGELLTICTSYKSKENYDDNPIRRPGDVPQHHRHCLP